MRRRSIGFCSLCLCPIRPEDATLYTDFLQQLDAGYGVILRPELKGSGLGLLLLQKMIAYLRGQGAQRLLATVLTCNKRMRNLA